MTPGTQSPFFLLLILTVLTGEGHKVGSGLPCLGGVRGLSVGFAPWQMHHERQEFYLCQKKGEAKDRLKRDAPTPKSGCQGQANVLKRSLGGRE